MRLNILHYRPIQGEVRFPLQEAWMSEVMKEVNRLTLQDVDFYGETSPLVGISI
jgi:hypothetical protein